MSVVVIRVADIRPRNVLFINPLPKKNTPPALNKG